MRCLVLVVLAVCSQGCLPLSPRLFVDPGGMAEEFGRQMLASAGEGLLSRSELHKLTSAERTLDDIQRILESNPDAANREHLVELSEAIEKETRSSTANPTGAEGVYEDRGRERLDRHRRQFADRDLRHHDFVNGRDRGLARFWTIRQPVPPEERFRWRDQFRPTHATNSSLPEPDRGIPLIDVRRDKTERRKGLDDLRAHAPANPRNPDGDSLRDRVRW